MTDSIVCPHCQTGIKIIKGEIVEDSYGFNPPKEPDAMKKLRMLKQLTDKEPGILDLRYAVRVIMDVLVAREESRGSHTGME